VWDVATGAPVGDPLRGHEDLLISVAFSSHSRRIVSGSDDGSDDETIRVWDAATGAPVGDPLRGHEDFVTSVAFSSDGRHIVSGSDDKTIRVWDAATGAPVGDPLRGHEHSVTPTPPPFNASDYLSQCEYTYDLSNCLNLQTHLSSVCSRNS